jgi:hypothetical protein
MGSKALRVPDALTVALDQIEILDTFPYYVTGDLWTAAVAGTGTVTHEGSSGGGRMRLFCTAANDAAVLATTNELFKLTASKAMKAIVEVDGSDVDTDDGMIAVGWADALAATTLADTTGAVTATDAILLYKLPDTSVWALHTEINGTASASVSTTSALTGSPQVLEIEVTPRSSTVFEVRAKVDGVLLKNSAGTVIMHTITLGTATEMDFGVITKSNDAADFIAYVNTAYAAQVR